jgi:hypothetical protein
MIKCDRVYFRDQIDYYYSNFGLFQFFFFSIILFDMKIQKIHVVVVVVVVELI